ncbi:hypothetical protein EJ05DRAFT_456751 [Pseudovirgaria hyperparasitica]|uniref:Hamartin-domain-containing protein n=1 Tax=Pseudovirgaria hyperparasitica TaxID=470096 RepID=A0A6A6VV77_9PEZI|nr:uncharacterized protein EJ05DRAFT_456751 [Pseudovirgaria hyperparasitica]KAF2754588.1 hypothetical protein EJ05DRAFT_456751 [Pseudovirgaria hyperparasitica]
MSSGTMKETLKALNNVFSSPETFETLPDELIATIESFLDNYHGIDEHDSQRLHEELLSIHKKYVADFPLKRAAFLGMLTRIRPAIRGDERLSEWWNLVIAPTINAVGHKRDEVEYAREFLLGVMSFDSDEDDYGEKAETSSRFCRRLLDAYLERTRIPSSSSDPVSPVDEFIAHELESILVSFGRKKPRELLQSLNSLFVQVEHRAQILGLMSAFVRTQPPHLYYVLDTSLIQNLLICLMKETSSTIVELALTVLIMLLPHITNSMKQHMARLFLVYVRILCWDIVVDSKVSEGHEPSSVSNLQSFISQCAADLAQEVNPGHSWITLDRSFEQSRTCNPPLVHYFTFLYGLFPLNFMSFIRKSRKWLKGHNFPRADEFEFNQDIIQSRSQEYRMVHLLHPNFYITTVEDELTDNRYLNSDPADVVTECMGLCVAVSSNLDDPGPPPTSKLPVPPGGPGPIADAASITMVADDDTLAADSVQMSQTQSVIKGSPVVHSSWQSVDDSATTRKNSQTSLYKSPSKTSTIASPLLKPHDSPTLPGRASDLHLPEKDLLPLVNRITNQAPEKLEAFAQLLSSGRICNSSSILSEHETQSMVSLQREVMLLRNDLNFERYLKHQHLAHIGQLQRKNLKEATAEAQTQNLINTNRALKAKLTKSDELNAQLKKEFATSRGQSRKVEDQISTKLKQLKEDQKSWRADGEALRFELNKTQDDCSRLKKLVDDSDARELRSQHQLRALDSDLGELDALRSEASKLRVQLREAQFREQIPRQIGEERQQLRNDLEVANMKLTSRDKEREKTIQGYERYIAELESRLHNEHGLPQELIEVGNLPPAVQQMIDSALASSHAKLQQLKKTHSRLHDRYIELEMRSHEIERERERDREYPAPVMRSISIPSTSGRTTPSRDPMTLGTSLSSTRRPGSRASASQATRFARVPEDINSDEDNFHSEYNNSQLNPSFEFQSHLNQQEGMRAARPVRSESSQQTQANIHHYSHPQSQVPLQQQAVWQSSSTYSDAQHSPRNTGSAYETALDASFNTTPPSVSSEPVTSSAKSTMSWDSSEKREGKKDKIAPESKVRVYGRGGAQNIGVKKKEKEAKGKDKDREKTNKSGGFRGLRGIM